jgi:hypothetical protein
VLRGSVIDHRLASGANAHFQLHIVDDATHYRIAVNVESKLAPSELEYVIDSNFRHPVLDARRSAAGRLERPAAQAGRCRAGLHPRQPVQARGSASASVRCAGPGQRPQREARA